MVEEGGLLTSVNNEIHKKDRERWREGKAYIFIVHHYNAISCVTWASSKSN